MLLRAETDDPKENIRRQHDWIKSLKAMGEEPYEIECDVDALGKMLIDEFMNWLQLNRIPLPTQIADFTIKGLTRFLLLRGGRRMYSPLTCGKKLKSDFMKALGEEMEVTPAVDFMTKETLRLFTEFRKTLIPTIQ